jgi:hypothetical protein
MMPACPASRKQEQTSGADFDPPLFAAVQLANTDPTSCWIMILVKTTIVKDWR